MTTIANVITRFGHLTQMTVHTFTPTTTPHGKLVGKYGVALRGSTYVPVSCNNKAKRWQELARTPSGNAVFYTGTHRGKTQTVTVSEFSMKFMFNELAKTANGAPSPAVGFLNSDCVLIDAKTKATQFINKNTSKSELESIIARRSMDKASVQILDLSTQKIRNVYVTEVVTTVRLAI